MTEVSGYACEFFLRVFEESPWVISHLFDLIDYALDNEYYFDRGFRIPLQKTHMDSQLTHLLLWPPEDLPHLFQLKSGKFQLLEVIPITDTENKYADNHSNEALYEILKTLPNFPLINPRRLSCVSDSDPFVEKASNDSDFLLEEASEEREEIIYPSLFTNMPENICTLNSPEGQDDPLYFSGAGIFEVPPSAEKNYWSYITSGMSNPFEDFPEEISGYGFELLVRVPEHSPWVFPILLDLMRYVLKTGNYFDVGHRMPLIAGNFDSQLNALLFCPPKDFPSQFKLKSGEFQLLEVIGITEAEYEYAKENSSQALYEILETLPNFPLTDISRSCCINSDTR